MGFSIQSFCLVSLVFMSSCSNVVVEDLTFSNTQKWNNFFTKKRELPQKRLKDSFNNFPPPPSNLSKITQEEIGFLLNLQKDRTQEDIEFIKSTQFYGGIKLGELPLNELRQNFPETAALMDLVDEDLGPLIFKLKKRFDRVRPHHLDKRISTAIEIPSHPAYPSGHAGQTHAYAILLSFIDPFNKEKYLKSALKISQHREVAGAHYPSDTRAGIDLASKVMNIFELNPDFVTQLTKARLEFKNKNALF